MKYTILPYVTLGYPHDELETPIWRQCVIVHPQVTSIVGAWFGCGRNVWANVGGWRRHVWYPILTHMGVSINGGSPKMVGLQGKIPLKWMIWGAPLFQETSILIIGCLMRNAPNEQRSENYEVSWGILWWCTVRLSGYNGQPLIKTHGRKA